jgi:hypothetical protein
MAHGGGPGAFQAGGGLGRVPGSLQRAEQLPGPARDLGQRHPVGDLGGPVRQCQRLVDLVRT